MATEISRADLNYPAVGQAVPTASSGVVSNSGTIPAPEARSDPQSSHATQVVSVFARLQEQQGLLGKAAASVRDMGNEVQQAASLLDQAKKNLNQIVKMYPPYPVGSAQRMAILNEVSGLRQQVEQLTFPPPESLKLVDQVLGQQPGSASKSGAQGVEAMVKAGVSSLATLDPTSASDAAVSQALVQVESLQSTLHQVSTGMWQDVVGFVAQAVSPESLKLGTGVGQQLAGLSGLGIGVNAALLQQVTESH